MDSIPEFPGQVDLDFCHQEFISDILTKKEINSSDFAFYNLLGWYLDRPARISRIDNHLIIDVEGPAGSHFFLPPLGEGSIRHPVCALLKNLPSFATPPVLKFVPSLIRREILAEFTDVQSDPQRADFDYLHDRRQLAELSGRKFHQKKNFVNRLLEELNPTIDYIREKDIDEIFSFLDGWYKSYPVDDLTVKIEALAVKRMLPLVNKIGGMGILVRIADVVAGVTLAAPINSTCWVVPLEKADRNIKGLYQFINWALANRLPESVSIINRETDLGIEGLRAAKASYHPTAFEEKYTLRF